MLRSSEEVLLRVNESTSLHIDNLHLNRERLVNREVLQVRRHPEFGRGHGLLIRDSTHWCWVTRAILLLLSIREFTWGPICLGEEETEVDEVVCRGEGCCLACLGVVLIQTILCETGLNNAGIEGQGGLSISSSSLTTLETALEELSVKATNCKI